MFQNFHHYATVVIVDIREVSLVHEQGKWSKLAN